MYAKQIKKKIKPFVSSTVLFSFFFYVSQRDYFYEYVRATSPDRAVTSAPRYSRPWGAKTHSKGSICPFRQQKTCSMTLTPPRFHQNVFYPNDVFNGVIRSKTDTTLSRLNMIEYFTIYCIITYTHNDSVIEFKCIY